MEDFKCNILILGKTGVGKSSLLNYICEKQLAVAGAGKPKTGKGIYEYTATINGQQVRIFDSWGIEAGSKTEEWENLLKTELEKRNASKPPSEWFHSCIYCIGSGGSRVEDIDAKIINMLASDGYNVAVILTKADQSTLEEEQKMRNAILESVPNGKISIISAISEKKKIRAGNVEPQGRDEIVNNILSGWKKTVISRIPIGMTELVSELVVEKTEYFKNLCHNYSGRDIGNNITYFYEILNKMIWKIYYPICLKRLISGCMLPGEKLAKMLKVVPSDADKGQNFVLDKDIYDRIMPFITKAREYDDSWFVSTDMKNKNADMIIRIMSSHLKEKAVKIGNSLRQSLEQNL